MFIKTTTPFILLLALFSIGCSKPNESTSGAPAVQKPDAEEYISYTLQGDSFTNEKFEMLATANSTSGNFGNPNTIISFSAPASGYTISAYLTLSIKNAGFVSLDTIKNTSRFIFSGKKGAYFIRSNSGRLIITHYPDSINEYLKGTFEGSYTDLYNDHRTFTITNGLFKIKRKK